MMYALVDGNSFYCSCERIFDPELKNRPVVVLSNNDGCIVALTGEAKKAGLKRGMPFFKAKKELESKNVACFSSNYELYGDISSRMMRTIATVVPRIEVYSIDECFAVMDGVENQLEAGREIRKRVKKWVGVPTCVGIAPTRTLAKLCNHLAKKRQVFDGVLHFDMLSTRDRVNLFKDEPVDEIWGINGALAGKLARAGIRSVYDFVTRSYQEIAANYPINMQRTYLELNGVDCVDSQGHVDRKHQIVSSRSFSHPVTDIEELRGAVAMHARAASEKLRQQKSKCLRISVFLDTNRFRDDLPQHHPCVGEALMNPASEMAILNKKAQRLLSIIYREGYEYKKCGVVLSNLTESCMPTQLDLFSPPPPMEASKVQRAIDDIAGRYGKTTLVMADEIKRSNWSMRRELLSPFYTTRLSQIMKID